MKKILGLALSVCVCLAFAGCGIDELKKEVESKTQALNRCEADKAGLNKKVKELTATLEAKETEAKKGRELLDASQGELTSLKSTVDMQKAELDKTKAELETASAQLQECKAAAEAAAKKGGAKKK